MVAFNAEDHLRLIQSDGKIEWSSPEQYGGTPLYFLPPGKATGNLQEKEYLPIRIRTADLENDGKLQVIVPQNKDTAGRLLSQQRFYGKSRIEAFMWDGLGLTSIWKTRQLSGRIQDFKIADFDNDGQLELLAAVVTKEGAIVFTDAQSTLISFDLKTGK